MTRLLALALFFLFPHTAAAQGQVHVVDAAAGPGAEFTTILDAVVAAADGDVLLVRGGDYFAPVGFINDGVWLGSKGLVITAEVGAQVRTNNLLVRNLPATSHVVVQGLSFPSFGMIAADLDDCRGPIWLERCASTPGGFFLTDGGIISSRCDSLVLVRSLATTPLVTPSSAVFALNSRVHVFDSDVRGTIGGALNPAIRLRAGSHLQLFGSSVQGGDGADGNAVICDGQEGADGIRLETSSFLVAHDSGIAGGAGGAPFGSCSPGAEGQGVVVLPGSRARFLSGVTRSHEVSSPVREDELVHAEFRGRPGDRVWLATSAKPVTGTSPRFWVGELLLGTPRSVSFVGTVPASGVLQISAPVPPLAPGEESRVFFGQAFFRHPSDRLFAVSSPSVLVVLDEAF